MSRPRILVSACLLGHHTRYDGRLKRDPRVCDLADRWELVPVCPEVDCGLPTPRDPMHLERDHRGVLRLMVTASREDHSHRIYEWIDGCIASMIRDGVDGCILKSRSPSCGLTGVSLFTPTGMEFGEGMGLFAAAIVNRLPSLPVVEDDLLDEHLPAFARRLS